LVHLSEAISSPASEVVCIPANRMGYGHLDDLLSGVLQLEEPAWPTPPNQEMVSYQPTPARHIFHLLRVTELSAADVLVDLGSGLGHVALLVSICIQARSIGVELEAAYIESARQCAHGLNLNNVTFLKQDARS
jgi:predicted RNA methylase